MKRIYLLALLPIIIISFTNCTTGGAFISHNVTNVELSDSEFNIVAKNIEGTSKSSYIIGVTYSSGFVANTLAIARVGGSAKLYNDAIQNLWSNYEKEYGEIGDRNLVLANIRVDSDMLNLILYTESQLFITADIVEFTK